MNGTPQVETQSERAAKAGSLAAVLDRYRPAALAVAAIIAVVTVLPGADDPDSTSASAVAALPFEEVAAPELEVAAPAPEAAAEPPTLVAEPVSAPAADAAPLDDGFSDVPAAPPAEEPAPVQEEPAPAPAEQEDSSQAAPPPAAAPAPARPAAAAEPLEPTTTGYASRTAGTPLAANGVPEGSLPVGLRVGVLDKASFVRLSGTAVKLVLTEVAEGTRGDAAAATLQACQITDKGWKGEEAQSFEEAPDHDEATCAPGTRDAKGTWTFDLTAFPTRTDDRGFALVPGDGGATDFQVALKG